MALELPTDTQHLLLDSRQYELFGRSLGEGISRRQLYIGAVACLLCWTVLAVIGVNPLSKLGPSLYLVPPFAIVYFGTRAGDDGRMRLMRWYDLVLMWHPRRRRLVQNPLIPDITRTAVPLALRHVVELQPDRPSTLDRVQAVPESRVPGCTGGQT